MKTVVYDYQIFSHQKFGGVSRYFCEVAARIREQGDWRAIVIAPLHFNTYLAVSDVPKRGVYTPLPFARMRSLYDVFNRVATPLVTPSGGIDVVHQTYYGPARSVGRSRLVVTVFDMIHELFPHYFRANDPVAALKRRAIERADHVICISHQTAADLMKILNVPAAKITVTHLGASQIFDESRSPDRRPAMQRQRPFFLYVGQRAGYKNFARVLEAFAAASKLAERFDLVAFGGPAFSPDELSRIKALGLANAVRQLFGDDEALARCYSEAHAFVYPSEYEGFGIPPLEAMNCGCPIACSNTSSIPEVTGAAAEYFEPQDVDSIGRALEALAFDDTRRQELITAATVQRKLFSWERCAAETLAAYQAA